MAAFSQRALVLGTILSVAALTTSGCKACAEVVAEKGVKAAKDTTKGLEEGIDKGRKAGESADGALIVSSPEELKGKGTVTVHGVRGSDAAASTEIDLAVENLGEQPLRLTGLGFEGFDKEGFTKRPNSGRTKTEVTVAAHSKEKPPLRSMSLSEPSRRCATGRSTCPSPRSAERAAATRRQSIGLTPARRAPANPVYRTASRAGHSARAAGTPGSPRPMTLR